MGTRKKGSDLIFNLQWRNMPDNGGDRSNVVGMCDTPATTLNFETFKSYLLKNSGVVCNDVKVTYLTDNGAEWVIDSEEWFEIALCAFRLKARLGEVIFLKLDKIYKQMTRKHSNDAETQFDNDPNRNSFDAPPEWFLTYMKQFKRDLVEEVTYVVSSNFAANVRDKEKEHPPLQNISLSKKMKPESSKRSRKHMILGETPIDKELLKTLKYDRKLEIKLDKLDAKTKKIKEKKQALINKLENEEQQVNNKQPNVSTNIDDAPLMNASLVNESQVVPHMLGGETYLHSWEVINNGKLSWTSATELRLTWGSADMKPSSNVIRCPLLEPGEKGAICARFQIPLKPGQYESYWNFYDKGMRFGHWLVCCVIVDGPAYYFPEKTLIKKAKFEEQEHQTNVFSENEVIISEVGEGPEKKLAGPKQYVSQENFVLVQDCIADSEVEGATGIANSVIDLSKRIQDIKIVSAPQVDSDSDWESVWSFGGSRKQKNSHQNNQHNSEAESFATNKYGINEKDLIVDLSKTKVGNSPSPRQSPDENETIALQKENHEVFEQNQTSNDDNNNNGGSINKASSGESICEIGSEASSDLSSGYDVISGPVCEEREDSGYVYITIDGNKLPVPKHILRPDFLANAEEAPGPITLDDERTGAANNQDASNASQGSVTNAEKLESQIQELEQDIQETKSFMSHCSAAGTCFSDVNVTPSSSSRLFIFPQTNPGFEVVYPKLEKEVSQGIAVSCPTNQVETVPSDPSQAYTWASSETQYTLTDVQNACNNMNNAQLKYDPYGPLDQSRSTSSQGSVTSQNKTFQHVPNYQQSNPKPNKLPQYKPQTPSAPSNSSPPQRAPSSPVQSVPQVHILPENLVSGAVNVASSAINTARSVINMIVPPKSEPGKWVNGHWVTANAESTRARNLCILAEMGFWDTDLNATLLARYNDDISRVVSELLQ